MSEGFGRTGRQGRRPRSSEGGDQGDGRVVLGIPGYEDAIQIGEGGFGVVYRARQIAFDRTVAVKVISARLAPETRVRFERECRALGKLSGHPHVITVYDSGFNDEGRPYIAMDYIPGGSLADLLRSRGPLGWVEAVDIAVKLAGVLETAHRYGILHRDIKPHNVLLSRYGEPLLADFGVATVRGGPETLSGEMTGSLTHAAPEILDGRRPSRASDVYSLASTIYTLLAGRPAFVRDTDEGVYPLMARILADPVPDLRPQGVPDLVCRALERAMAKDPDARHEGAAAFGADLQRAQEEAGITPTAMRVTGEEASRLAEDEAVQAPSSAPGGASPGSGHDTTVSRARGQGPPPPPTPSPALAAKGRPERPPDEPGRRPSWSWALKGKPPTVPEEGEAAGEPTPAWRQQDDRTITRGRGGPTPKPSSTPRPTPPPSSTPRPSRTPDPTPSPTAKDRPSPSPEEPGTRPTRPWATRDRPSPGGDRSSPERDRPAAAGDRPSAGGKEQEPVDRATGWRHHASTTPPPPAPAPAPTPAPAPARAEQEGLPRRVLVIAGAAGALLLVIVLGVVLVGGGGGGGSTAEAQSCAPRSAASVPAAAPGPGPPPGAPNVSPAWRVPTEGKVRSAPAAGNGMVYFARDDGKIAAVSARSGAEGWQFDADEPVLSSPTLAGGTLYAASAAGKVYALDATSGDEQWAFEAEPLCSAVAVGNGAAYVGTNAGTVYAIDAASGEQRWTFATSGRVSSAPAVEGTTVYFGSLDRFLYAVSGTGQLLWKFALGGEMATSPVVGNGLVYAATRDGYLYSLDAASGQFRSSFSTGAPIESLTVSGQTAYVGSGGENLRALAVTAPQTRWQRAIPGGSSPPRVHNCVVYAGSAQRDVYALDAANGNELWRYPTQAGVGGMSVVDGSLYVATLDGFLHKLTPPEPAPPPPVC